MIAFTKYDAGRSEIGEYSEIQTARGCSSAEGRLCFITFVRKVMKENRIMKIHACWSEVYPVKPICLFCLTGAEIPS